MSPDKTSIIQASFEQYATNESPKKIINNINARGIPVLEGKYLGLLACRLHSGTKNNFVILKCSDWKVAGGCKVFIDKKVFLAVQEY